MRGTRQQPNGTRSGPQVDCCLTPLHFLVYLLADELCPVILAELGNVIECSDAPRQNAALAVVVAGKMLEDAKINYELHFGYQCYGYKVFSGYKVLWVGPICYRPSLVKHF